MSDIIERAEEALVGVTRGPWKMGNRRYPEVVHTPHGCLWDPERGEINGCEDGAFVAAARTLVPELVAALKAAWAENGRLIDALRCAREGCDGNH